MVGVATRTLTTPRFPPPCVCVLHSLGPLVRKVRDNQVEAIINKLCANMFSDDERLRDISSVGKYMERMKRCRNCVF